MGILKFEDIIAWQKAQDLAVLIYTHFKNLKDYGFRDQITRAVISILNNIAEGFDRSSDADFSRFLNFSIVSCSEVKSMLHLAYKLNYISEADKDNLIIKADEVSKIIKGLIKSLNLKQG